MTVKARIRRPAKSAMQSGRAKTKHWLFEYDPAPKLIDPLMGWTGSSDTLSQLRLRFPTLEAAIAFAEEKGIPYEIEEPHAPVQLRKSYADNFRYDKVETFVPGSAGKTI